MINAGKYRHKITIYAVRIVKDAQGFQGREKVIVLEPYASVKTLKGITLIRNNTDFERATTNFTIRYPKTPVNRDMLIEFHGKTYRIEYLNNVNEESTELEIQAKEVTH